MTSLALPLADLDWLKRRVMNFAEDRPGVYRMLSPAGKVIYVGKAKRVRTRLLSYFSASYPEDKGARILHAAGNIEWDYSSSEFTALLKELRQIKRFQPHFNVRMKRSGRPVLIKLIGGDAPKLMVGTGPGKQDTRHYGPFRSRARAQESVQVLSDLLQLRDCALSMRMTFAEQTDLFESPAPAACHRYAFGTCLGPCAGLVTELEYRDRVNLAINFLEGRSADPLNRVITAMEDASANQQFELAARWRERFEELEWLFRATVEARTAISALSFVYLDPGTYGDDRAFVVRRATVRAEAPAPQTPIEHAAFRAAVEEHAQAERADVPLPVTDLDEMLLLLRWFNRHPSAMARTVPIEEWLRNPAAVS